MIREPQIKNGRVTGKKCGQTNSSVRISTKSAQNVPWYSRLDNCARLIGRNTELSRLSSLLNTHPLITVTGSPGIGKTALSCELLRNMSDESGQYIVYLISCQNHTITRGAIFDALQHEIGKGISEARDIEQLLRGNNKSFVIYIDGLDLSHDSTLQSTRKAVISLLDEIVIQLKPNQHILVTGREEIGISSETLFPLCPLPPKDALELFCRERKKRKGFNALEEITDESLLDLLAPARGIPLAIMLAACESTPFLPETCSENSCDVTEVIRHAYTMFPPDSIERRLFTWMSLLPAGMSEECLCKLFPSNGINAMKELRDRMLVTMEPDGPSHYKMQAKVREVARELFTQDELIRAEKQVLRYYSVLVDKETDKVRRNQSIHATEILRRELPNIHAMMLRAYTRRNEVGFLSLLRNLSRLYQWRSIEEGLELLDFGQKISEQSGRLDDLGYCLWSKGELLHRRRMLTEAFAYYHRGESVYEQAKNPLGQADCLKGMGDVYRRQDEYQKALDQYDRAMILYGDNPRGIADIHKAKADVLRKLDNLDLAVDLLNEARKEYVLLKDFLGIANCIRSEAEILRQQAQFAKSRIKYEEATKMYEDLGASLGKAQCLQGIGDVCWLQDKYEEAWVYYAHAKKLYEEVGDRLGLARMIYGMGQVARRQGSLNEALTYFRQAEVEYIGIGSRLGIARSIRGKGDIYFRKGYFEMALSFYQQSRKISREIGSLQIEAESLRGIAQVLLQQERYDDSHRQFASAWQLYDKIGAGLGKHYTVQGFGDISKAKGNYNEAITYYNEALDFFEKHENYLAALTTVTSLLEIYEIIHDMDNLNIYREKEEEFRKNLNARKTFISSDNSIDIKELISV